MNEKFSENWRKKIRRTKEKEEEKRRLAILEMILI